MKRIYMMPTPTEARGDTTNAIHQIVLKLQTALPEFGYTLVEAPDQADLIVGHAGQGAAGVVDVAMCHGLYPTATPGAAAWHWAANRSVISNLVGARQITVPSQWVADILRRDMHVNPHVIGWAIEGDQWHPGESAGYVLWNKTRQDHVCDPTPIIELAARLPEHRFLTTFGTGTPNLRTIGRQPYEAMKAVIRGAEVYLATTKETFGIGTLEAMACGLPVLGYRWGGTADIVEHGVTGYLVEPGDIDGLVEGLAYCRKHRAVLGANARQVALSYTWARVAQKLSDVFKLALAPHDGPTASVVIPCFNYARFVGEAIDSVRAQEAPFEIEIIVVDDGSTDSSRDAARAHLDPNNPLHRIIEVPNGGVANARNVGIAMARGEYVVCLDADDRLGDSRFVATLAGALDSDRALGIAFTGLTVMDEAGKLSDAPSQWPSGYDYDAQVAGKNQVPTCCMFRKEAWRRAGGYRSAYEPAEDARLWLTIGALGYRAAQVTRAGWFHYRLHGNSLSSSVRKGDKREPNWRANLPWIDDNKRPFASDGRPTPNPHSWPVRNYDRPLVSFVVPVGPGHARYLPEALDSIEAQTERQWECIVVNDSGQPLDSYSWARVVTTDGGKGASHARNRGIAEARAPLVAFLDADDLLHPRFLERTLRVYGRSGRYVYTDWISLNKQGVYEQHETPEYVVGDVFRRTSIHSINVLIPRRWLFDVGGFDESMTTWEDVDLFMNLAARGYCGQRCPEALVTYRYATGTLRESGEPIKDHLKALLRERYYEFIVEGKTVGCCGLPKRQNAAMLPQANNVELGEAVRVEYVGESVGVAKHTVVGAATRTNYRRRARGDVFHIWRKDYDAAPDRFQLAPEVASMTEIEPTPVPPEPTPL